MLTKFGLCFVCSDFENDRNRPLRSVDSIIHTIVLHEPYCVRCVQWLGHTLASPLFMCSVCRTYNHAHAHKSTIINVYFPFLPYVFRHHVVVSAASIGVGHAMRPIVTASINATASTRIIAIFRMCTYVQETTHASSNLKSSFFRKVSSHNRNAIGTKVIPTQSLIHRQL